MTNKQNNQDIEPETNETEPANPCLDFDTLRKVAKYHEAMPQAIENIVALIDELEPPASVMCQPTNSKKHS